MKRALNSIKGKCPKCYHGDLWPHRVLRIKEFPRMNRTCNCCGQNFFPEIGFYEGAMYVSYAFNVALVITFFTAFNILFSEIDYDWLISLTIGTAVLMMPLTYRLSKNIWAYFFYLT